MLGKSKTSSVLYIGNSIVTHTYVISIAYGIWKSCCESWKKGIYIRGNKTSYGEQKSQHCLAASNMQRLYVKPTASTLM